MKKKILLFILVMVLVYAIGGVVYYYFNKPKEEENKIVEIPSLDKIDGYDYILKSNDSEYYKELFNSLKSVLENKDVDDEEYAKLIAQMFICDLYTLDNKINKYDVGGSRFVLDDYVSNYKLNVQNTLYKYLEDNSNNNRKQELPIVTEIKIKTSEKTNYKIGDNSYSGYKITLEWTYKEDLGYDSKGEVTLIKNGNKYYVVQKD